MKIYLTSIEEKENSYFTQSLIFSDKDIHYSTFVGKTIEEMIKDRTEFLNHLLSSTIENPVNL